MTGWAMLGLEAAGRNPLDVSRGGTNPVAYLRYRVDQLESSGDFARTILALEGAGVDPRSFGGRDLVSALLKRRRDDGSYDGWPGSTAYAVIALRAAGAGGSLDKSLCLARGRPEQGRRLGGHARRAEQRRRHRRRDAGDARHEGRPAGPLLPAQAPARQRRLRGRLGRRGQHPVDRLGGGGDDGRRRRLRRGRRRPRLHRLPAGRQTATTATRAPATRPRSG